MSYAAAAPMGGFYGWSGPSQNVIVRSGQESDTVMQAVDLILDEGDLTSGDFTKLSSGGYGFQVR